MDKRSKLPKWISQYMSDATINLSTDMGCVAAKTFLRSMAQPFEKSQLGISLWWCRTLKCAKKRRRPRALQSLELLKVPWQLTSWSWFGIVIYYECNMSEKISRPGCCSDVQS